MPDTVVMPSEGKQLIANWWLGSGPEPMDTLSLHLFKNEPDPFNATLVEADFVESDFDGYEAAEYAYGENGTPVLESGEYRTQIGDEAIEFTCDSGTQTVRGWYLLDDDSGKVLYACLYENPVGMIPGATHTVDLKIGTGMAS